MARMPVPSSVIRGFQYVLENNFTGGLKTEFTGLNFPENACTETENCTFFHTGAVFRRNGFDMELGGVQNAINFTAGGLSTFIWKNAGGDGQSQLFVSQVGPTLYFYNIGAVLTPTVGLSATLLAGTVNLASFGTNFNPSNECQYAAGNGYLFVFQQTMDPIYVTYANSVITPNKITIQIRDFQGILEPGVPLNLRSTGLTAEHKYNLENQGWTSSSNPAVTANSSSNIAFSGVGVTQAFTIAAGLNINVGNYMFLQTVGGFQNNGTQIISGTQGVCSGIVVSYSGTTVVCNLFGFSSGFTYAISNSNWILTFSATQGVSNLLQTWNAAIGNYPSNGDIWWQFKDSTNTFNPLATIGNVTLNSAQAPQGYFIMNAFIQDRSLASGVTGLTPVTTTARPRTGAFFAGRTFYAGVDASQGATGDAQFYTWTENIYFSQIYTDITSFGQCYQTNDPTSETLFDVLPSDGGVIVIPGAGAIYKLFPITNGLLVFASNGVWFITGSTGIGFSATDYVVSKIAAIQSIAGTSFVDVLGYPMFWNEEGIYQVALSPEQQGLSVNSLTLMTIKQFYDQIPRQSKRHARGSYNPITGQVQWIYNSQAPVVGGSQFYQFDSVLTFSMFTQAFYTWNFQPSNIFITSADYVVYTSGGPGVPNAGFKYLTTNSNGSTLTMTFAEERDNVNWVDWTSLGFPTQYTSNFTTGYRLHGDGQRKWQPGYVYMYSDNSVPNAYIIQGAWNYALTGDSGRFSVPQVINNNLTPAFFAKAYRRVKIRGRGTVLQLMVSSLPGKPFHIDGWSIWETQNASV